MRYDLSQTSSGVSSNHCCRKTGRDVSCKPPKPPDPDLIRFYWGLGAFDIDAVGAKAERSFDDRVRGANDGDLEDLFDDDW